MRYKEGQPPFQLSPRGGKGDGSLSLRERVGVRVEVNGYSLHEEPDAADRPQSLVSIKPTQGGALKMNAHGVALLGVVECHDPVRASAGAGEAASGTLPANGWLCQQRVRVPLQPASCAWRSSHSGVYSNYASLHLLQRGSWWI